MFKVYRKAEQLPQIWDEIAGENIFLHRPILQRLETENPCGQNYHLNEEAKVALVSYKLKLNLLTFTQNFSLSLPVNIIGVPMSVAKPGYAFYSLDCGAAPSQQNGYGELKDQPKLGILEKYIKSLKGLWLVLNAEHRLNLSQGQTLPTCKLELQWKSFDSYLSSMRSHYRYRFSKALQRFATIKVEELEDNRCFDQELYELYEKVYERSREKLEKLPIGFFRNFPAKLLKFSFEGKVVGFVQLLERDEELIFLFCGFEQELNQKYDLYLNMLLQIVSFALRRGFKWIDLGQTTEATKLKLGAKQETKYLYLHHSNSFINSVLKRLVGKFSYKPYAIIHKVFKETDS